MISFQKIACLLKKAIKLYLDLKIIWKLIIGFGLSLVAVFLVAGISQISIYKLHNTVKDIINNELEPLVYLNDIRSYISELEITTRDALLQRDAIALNYIRNEFLPKNVCRTVNYSLERLLVGASNKGERERLEDIKGNWEEYSNLYREILSNENLFSNYDSIKELNRVRFFLIGGIDRLVETFYRQKAIIAKTYAASVFRKQQTSVVYIILYTIIIVLLLSVLTVWMITTPLTKMASASRRIAKGELNVFLHEDRQDEFGEVSHCFNIMVQELTLLVDQIKMAADRVNESSQKLLSGTRITTSVTQQLVNTLDNVAAGAETQQKNVTTAYDVVRNVSEFSYFINNTTKHVINLAEDSVAKALDGEKVAKNTVEKMHDFQRFMIDFNDSITKLLSLSGEIESMVQRVQDISEQTNLLSLNASIEAARAGSFGRSFGIVAKSIGELSQSTKEAALKTQSLVEHIQEIFNSLRLMINKENRIIGESEDAILGLDKIFDSIVGAAKQVDIALAEVKIHTANLIKKHHEMKAELEGVKNIAIKHKEGTYQASMAANEQYSYTQEIISTSQLLAYWGSNLRQTVDKFKTTTL